MSIILWHEVPTIERAELKPILSHLSDHELGASVESSLGLTESDALFGRLITTTQSFEKGRVVIANSLCIDQIDQRLDRPFEYGEVVRWLNAAGFILRLSRQTSEGCYGGTHIGRRLVVFGE